MTDPIAQPATPVAILPRKAYPMEPPDAVFALVAVVLGFLAWNWIWPRLDTGPAGDADRGVAFFPGVAVTIFFVLAVAASGTYFALHHVRLTRAGVIGAILVLLGAVPFTLYDTTPVHFFAGIGLAVGYVTWHAYAARTAVSTRLGALTTADVLNQGLVVPFSNLGAWFAALRSLARDRQRPVQVLLAAVGIIVALPVIAVVLSLLMSADARFNSWMGDAGHWLATLDIWHVIWQFALGLLVAIYLFGLLYGNAHRQGTGHISAERATAWAASARRISRVALVAPTVILCLIYLVFFAAMGSYLFLAFRHAVPGGFTYAEYARQGFFQLAVVAAINLAVLGLTVLFAKRETKGKGETKGTVLSVSSETERTVPFVSPAVSPYPRVLRVLGGVLSALTLLLIATAMSKMILYIDQYGLSRLRLYTLWFMAMLLVVFVLVGLWHIRAYRASTPIAVVILAGFLALTWANTDGLIADYNVNRYLDGQTSLIDANYLAENLSDAAVPALVKLRDQATDPAVQDNVRQLLATRAADGVFLTPSADGPWMSWNLQITQANGVLPPR